MSKKQSSALRRMDQPVYGYWQGLIRSFFSPDFYVDVALRWKGYGLLYLFLVALVFTIPLAVKVIYQFHNHYQQQIIQPLELLPSLVVQNGELQFDKPMPYIIKNKEGTALIIIDTTGEITTFDKRYPSVVMIINKNKIAFKQPKPEIFSDLVIEDSSEPVVNEQVFDAEMNEIFNGRAWLDSFQVKMVYYITLVLVYPILCLLFYGIYLTLLPMIALMGQAFSRIFFSYAITFKDSCRVLIVAASPMIFIAMLALALQIHWRAMGLFLMVLLSLYYSFAIICIRRQMTKVARQ